MNICFISNFSKTQLFSAIAKSLAAQGINAYWIACNEKLYEQLCEDYGPQKVLLINRSATGLANETIGDFKLNELVYGDRVLRHDYAAGVNFLTNIQQPIVEFLQLNEVRKIFGELTWAHELLIHRMCHQLEDLECQYLNPHVVRIPNRRFAFFTNEKQSQLYQLRTPHTTEVQRIVPKPPNYLKINKKILSKASSLKGKWARLKRFFTNENMDRYDPSLNGNTKIRLLVSVKEEWQRWQYRKVKRVDSVDLKNKSYLFLGLHKQPEASVDVLGRYYEDQYQNIVNLWRALPAGWSFLIKEHSIAIGDRPLSFYKKIQALPGVVLVNEQMPSYDLIKNAQLVATVSGTIAYEAALMGIPSITMAPCFFNQLHSCKKIGIADLDKYNLKEIADDLRHNESNLDEFSSYLYGHSFAGNVLDPITDPKVLSPENIERLTAAYAQAVFNRQKSLAV